MSLSKRDQQIEAIASKSTHPASKPEKALSTLNKLKRDYQTVLHQLSARDSEISSLKKNIMLCSSNEYKIQNEILMKEIQNLANLYESALHLNNNHNDVNINNNILKAE